MASRQVAAPAVSAPAPTGAAKGAQVGSESLVEPILVETYMVLIPALADVAAAEHAAHACQMPPDVDLKLETLPTAEVPALTYLASPNGAIERDRPEVKRTQRVLMMGVIGARRALEPIMRAGAACARSAAVAGRAWIVDFHTMQLFTLAEFDELRGGHFAVSADSLVTVHVWPQKGTREVATMATSGLVSFGLPELKLRDVPTDQAEMFSILLAAAQTLIERGRLDRPGMLDVDLHRLTGGTWPTIAKEIADDGGSGKASFAATWIEPTDRPREIELQLPGGTKEHASEVGHAYSPPRIFQQIPPAAEAAAARARTALLALAPRFDHGIPEGELLLVKVLRPLRNRDESEWLWLPATVTKDGRISFYVPDHIGLIVPYGAGDTFRVDIDQILDYLLLADGGKTVVSGGETDKFRETKPPARMRVKTVSPAPVAAASLPPSNTALPASPDRSQISDTIRPIREQIMLCGEREPTTHGQVKVHLEVAPPGNVISVKVQQTPSPSLGECIAAVMSKLTFPASRNGIAFAYPWNF
jgi:hypothetical protein